MRSLILSKDNTLNMNPAPNQVSVLSRYASEAISLAHQLGENPDVIKGRAFTLLSFKSEVDADAFLDVFLDTP